MTVHDLEYLIFREIRRLRGKVVKAFQRGLISKEKLVRLSASLVLAFAVFQVSFTSESSRPESSPPSSAGFVLSAQASLPTPTPIHFPERVEGSPDLEPILAKSAYVEDATSSAVLYEKEAWTQLPPASTIKVMTALVASRQFRPSETVVVPEECTRYNGGSTMGLKAGEVISVDGLLYGLLIASAADSACTLSLKAGPSFDNFVRWMNETAVSLGMNETVFTNPTGLDEVAGGNVSTAADLVKLAREALRDPGLRKIVSTSRITIKSEDGAIVHNLVNTNELLGTLPGAFGVKTGFTDRAGGCLIFAVERGGRQIIGVLLGSRERDRFDDARKIIDWVFRVYAWD